MDLKEWKKRLAALLREHPDITDHTTGHIEVHLNRGSITKLYRIESETKDEGAVKVITKKELK